MTFTLISGSSSDLQQFFLFSMFILLHIRMKFNFTHCPFELRLMRSRQSDASYFYHDHHYNSTREQQQQWNQLTKKKSVPDDEDLSLCFKAVASNFAVGFLYLFSFLMALEYRRRSCLLHHLLLCTTMFHKVNRAP